MNTTLQNFQHEEFGSIRVIQIDGEPWFVGNDIANALGYEKARNALTKHVDEDDALKRGVIDSMGRTQQTTIINESGLYSLILSSKLATAKKFKRWVTSEVLPSIRKHGAYATDDLLRQVAGDPEFALELLRKLRAEREKSTALEIRLETQAPKARYYDLILRCRNAVPVTLIAKDYGLSAASFNRLLHDLGVQFKVGGAWMLYQKHTGKGYTVSHTYHTGSGHAVLHTCWTQKGRAFLYVFLKDHGCLPLIEQPDLYQ